MAVVYDVSEESYCDISRMLCRIGAAGGVVTVDRQNEQEVDGGNDCVG